MSKELAEQLKSIKETQATQVKALAEQTQALTEQNKLLADENANIKKALAAPNRPEGFGKMFAVPRDAEAEGQWGFPSLGHFAKAVAQSRVNGQIHESIRKAYSSAPVIKAATDMGELVGSDGGFLVPPTFSTTLFERVYRESELLSRTDQYTVTGNSMVFPRNSETSRATGSRWGGVQTYWAQEGSTVTHSKPTFGRFTLNLHKLMSIAAITEELLQDSGLAISQYLTRAFVSEINFIVQDSIVRGTGAGQPLGILNAACTVSVAKDTNQTAATITSSNIVGMWKRRYALGPTGQYAWFVNQDVISQLYLLTLGIGTAGIATYMPPGGLSASPYATLLGAPVIEIEQCATLGTVGDIILADLSQMVSISKGSMQTASSMHLYFDSDQQAFKTTYRLDAQPWWPAALTPYQGSNTQSPFVTLATRS